MNDIDRIAMPPGVTKGSHTEVTEEGETAVEEQHEAPILFRLDGVDVPPNVPPQDVEPEVEDSDEKTVPGTEETAKEDKAYTPVAVQDAPALKVLKDIRDTAAAAPQAAAAAPPAQVIVPPVNVTVPPELIALFNQQLQLAAKSIVDQMGANVQDVVNGVIDNLPAQEADAVKRYPWLVPALDIAIGATAIGVLVFFIVGAVSFNNPLCKQYLGAVGMVILALFKRSPTTPATSK